MNDIDAKKNEVTGYESFRDLQARDEEIEPSENQHHDRPGQKKVE